MVNIAVAIKPEPLGPVRVSRRTGKPVYDPNTITLSMTSRKALECAFKLASFEATSTVTVISVAGEMGENILREGLAMGADRAVLIDHPLLRESDGLGIARALAAAVPRLDDCGIMVTGARTRDRYAGQVGPQMAALLGWPVASHVRDAQLGREGLRVDRELADGRRLRLKLQAPAVLTISPDWAGARWASGWGVTAAYQKEMETWGLDELGLGEDAVGPAADTTVVQKVEQAQDKERRNEVIEGEPEDVAALLHRRLASRGLMP